MEAGATLTKRRIAVFLLAVLLFLALCAVSLHLCVASRPDEQIGREVAGSASVGASSRLEAKPKVAEAKASDEPQARTDESEIGFDTRTQVLENRQSGNSEDNNLEFQANDTFESWVQSIEQISNPARREQALAEIRLALQSDDPIIVEAGLLALAATRAVEYDRRHFRVLVLECTESTDVNVRVAAVKGLTGIGLEATDVGVMVRLSGDSSAEVRRLVAFGLSRTATGPMVGEASAAALRLLEDPDSKVVASMLASIAAMPWTNKIEERVLALLQDPELGEAVIARALSPKREKSPQVVDALLNAASGDDAATRRKALAALRDGVPPDYAHVAADTLIDRFGSTSSVVARQELVLAIGRLATEAQLERLRDDLLNPMIGESERKQLLGILERLRR